MCSFILCTFLLGFISTVMNCRQEVSTSCFEPLVEVTTIFTVFYSSFTRGVNNFQALDIWITHVLPPHKYSCPLVMPEDYKYYGPATISIFTSSSSTIRGGYANLFKGFIEPYSYQGSVTIDVNGCHSFFNTTMEFDWSPVRKCHTN